VILSISGLSFSATMLLAERSGPTWCIPYPKDYPREDVARQCHGNSDSSAVRRRLASRDETDIV
jgi:hypothetical protein